MIATGWVNDVVHEPGSVQEPRSVEAILQGVLSAPSTAAERQQLRNEQAEAEARSARAQDFADSAAALSFMARFNGHAPRDVVADSMREPFRDSEAASRRRAAVGILKKYDLADVITGGQSGVVFDANLGIIEPVETRQDVAARAAMDRRYEFERSQRDAEARTRSVANYAARLDERMRAAGVGPRESRRSAVQPRHPSACNCLPCNGGDAGAQARNALAEIGIGADRVRGGGHVVSVR